MKTSGRRSTNVSNLYSVRARDIQQKAVQSRTAVVPYFKNAYVQTDEQRKTGEALGLGPVLQSLDNKLAARSRRRIGSGTDKEIMNSIRRKKP